MMAFTAQSPVSDVHGKIIFHEMATYVRAQVHTNKVYTTIIPTIYIVRSSVTSQQVEQNLYAIFVVNTYPQLYLDIMQLYIKGNPQNTHIP